MQQAQIKQKKLTNWLWLLPIAALGVGLWLAYNRLSTTGPEISIVFKSAEGLNAGNTKLRYKELDVGTVTDVVLSDDLSHVIVQAQMLNTAVPLLREDTQFWVVKPQISASGVSGLETILSGSYIAIDPGKSDSKARKFIGLEDIPLVTPSEPGLRIRLVTENAAGINVGTPLYYRGIKVGQVEQIKFDTDFSHLNLTVFIRAPYDALISTNTKFYNIGGFSFDVSTSGINLELNSLETLVLGGITFTTPASFITDSNKVDNNSVFTLYHSEKDSKTLNTFNKEYYVIYFDDSTRGLTSGRPVVLNGIKIGEVIDVRLLYDEAINQTVVPVLVEIQPDLIDTADHEPAENLIAQMVANGLQASIETANLITGQKMIALALYSDDIQTIKDDDYSSYQVLPSRSTGLSKLTEDIGEIITTVKELPLDKLFVQASVAAGKAANSMQSLNDIFDSPEISNIGQSIQSSINKFNGTMNSLQNLSKTTQQVLNELSKQLKQVTTQLERTLYGLSPESSMYYTIQDTLETLKRTAKSVDSITTLLNQKPNALIFGE